MKFIKHNIPIWQRYYYRAPFDKTEVKVFYDLGYQRFTGQRVSMREPNIYIEYLK